MKPFKLFFSIAWFFCAACAAVAQNAGQAPVAQPWSPSQQAQDARSEVAKYNWQSMTPEEREQAKAQVREDMQKKYGNPSEDDKLSQSRQEMIEWQKNQQNGGSANTINNGR